MTETTPRWEWRSFAASAVDIGSAQMLSPPDRIQESDELYLLSAEGTDTVKIRDDLMDVKHLVAVDERGLQQWSPVMKAGFPLSSADVGTVIAALGVVSPPLARDMYTLGQFMDELVHPHPDVVAADVHKRRERHTIGGCLAELTEVGSGEGSTRTIAIESEDPAMVMAALRELGLPPMPNVSFPRGLKSLLRLGTERYGVIDVGTNSVKFHLGERDADGRWRTVADRARVTRLGEGLHETDRLSPDPMGRTVEAIVAMADEAAQAGAAETVAVGTAGMRIASNSEDLIAAVRNRCGLTIEVVSGDEEARLAYVGTRAGIGPAPGSLVVFETGGGSSQFTFGHGDQVDERFSVDVGAVRYTEAHGLAAAVSEDALAEAFAAIAADLRRLDDRPTPNLLVAMGGAVTNMAAVMHALGEYDADIVHGTVLDRTEIDRQIELYRTRSSDERRSIIGLQPQRADIILAGACIVRTVLAAFGKESLTVSDRGLRHGLLVERFG
ncbi:Ppx/GppA phosphatase family protein [Aeromicrobium choanae]|uniref:Exopolyphosphatase / guanosine-5'-triphosphate,3'-diphosphate pyrophosphatase n=1 Tax=Aeromicrobium choanae TaxID=1736691 RepID=A0A1T4YSA0_9ACTN|nr:Ppx/GppA family phosphatase [Aeromicrobium choanae]SKB04714.1 exopolyphosphatase / guanosine-5'-triphosphate,3'-diphosphate pyrophosphatase [Aeromicrobium choanae]